MNYKRRDFLKLSAALGAGIAVSPFLTGLAGCSPVSRVNINKNFGLQLYTLRDDMPKDPKGVLRQVASFGYKQIESYNHDRMGIYWGMKNTEFKKFLDDLGMKLVSAHCDIDKDFDRTAAEAAEVGMEYLICPWIGPQKKLDDYKNFAETFNRLGETARKHGLRFAYHNHDYTFVPLEGQLPQDVLMQNTGKDLVDYQMDIYWVVTGGQDPIQWLNKYPDRFRLSHVKDRKKNVPLSDKDASTVVGTGQIDFAEILKHASKKGMRYFMVEQERYDGTTPLQAVKANAEYMKSLKV